MNYLPSVRNRDTRGSRDAVPMMPDVSIGIEQVSAGALSIATSYGRVAAIMPVRLPRL